MKIRVTDILVLEEFTLDDAPLLARHLNNETIYRHTLNIPHPYSLKHAKEWIRFTLQQRSENRLPHHFCLRLHDMELVGGIGLIPNEKSNFDHQAEIGYWVAEPFWGRGYMTETVSAFSAWVFQNFSLAKLTATIFADNIGSEKVLRKTGFCEEGFLRSHVHKDDNYLDCKVYSRLRNDFAPQSQQTF